MRFLVSEVPLWGFGTGVNVGHVEAAVEGVSGVGIRDSGFGIRDSKCNTGSAPADLGFRGELPGLTPAIEKRPLKVQ